MDCYYDDTIKLEDPETPASTRKLVERSAPKRRGIPVMIAATLLLVVTCAFALAMGFQKVSGQGTALEEAAPIQTFGQMPVVDSDLEDSSEDSELTDSELESEDGPEADTGMEEGSVLDCTEYDYLCDGNLLIIDHTYYTMTDHGPEPVELQNVSTEIELYGTWEVDFDYAVLDGELVLHNNTSREWYTILDGQRVTLTEYTEAGGDRFDDDITWITPAVATASILPGRSDLVMLNIRRSDMAIVDNCNYTLFYDLATGEISDPLSNVPDLFSYGSMSRVSFNASLTRGIVCVLGVGYLSDGEAYTTGGMTYISDLETGEMWSVAERMAQFLPEDTADGTTYEVYDGGCLWEDDDTLLFWVTERTPNGDEWVYTNWLGSYDCSTGTLGYLRRGVAYMGWIKDGSCPYLMAYSEEEDRFWAVDTATGGNYVQNQVLTSQDGYSYSYTDTRWLFYDSDLEFYLFDAPSHSYAVLPFAPEQLPDDIQFAHLVTDDWICIRTDSQMYFYHIPEGLRWTELEEAP
jgi:hypothetical protein